MLDDPVVDLGWSGAGLVEQAQVNSPKPWVVLGQEGPVAFAVALGVKEEQEHLAHCEQASCVGGVDDVLRVVVDDVGAIVAQRGS